MTTAEAIQRVLEIARSQLGVTEGANNWNIYAQELAAYPNLFWAGSKQNQQWCGTWCVWVLYKAFGLMRAVQMLCANVMPNGMAACKYGAQYFRDAGRWYTSPQPGDIIFYGPAGDEKHQGIVERVSGGTVTTIEGNYSDRVCRRIHSVHDSEITGYGRPRWELAADSSEENPAADTAGAEPGVEDPEAQPEKEERKQFEVTMREIRPGETGKLVRMVQAALIAEGYYCGGRIIRGTEAPDGEFGASTEQAVKLFQMKRGLPKTGRIDRETMEELLREE